MKRKIFIMVAVLAMISSILSLLVGCKEDNLKFNEPVETNYIDVDNEMQNPYGDINYIDSTIRFAYDSGYIGDNFTLIISAEISPKTMQEEVLLNWGVTVGDETLDPSTYVPPEEEVIETEHFKLGYNLNNSTDPEDLFKGTDWVLIQFYSAFPDTEYTIWCICREDPSIYDTVKLKYDGAPQVLTFGSVESEKYSSNVEESIDEVVFNNAIGDSLYFGYKHNLGDVGVDYVDYSPQIMLDSVESNVSMVFRYKWKTDEYSTNHNVGYIVVPLIDFYTNLITCSLTPSDTFVPVDDVITFTQKLYPADISQRLYLNNRYYEGYLDEFMGYVVTPSSETQINKPLSTNQFSYISSDQAIIKYNFVESYLNKSFSVNVTLAKNS